MVRRIDKRLTQDFDYGDSGAEDLGYGAPAPAPAPVSVAPPESDPWAWQAWAATQNPEQNAWKTGEIKTTDLPSIKPVLEKKGLWNPEWDVALSDPAYWDTRHETEQGQVGSEPTKSLDLSALKDYKVGSARSSGYNVLNAVLGPDGKPLGGFVSSQEGGGSLKAKDWAQIAAMATMVFGGAAAPALGAAMGAGTGTLGTMAGAAALGAGTGALNASANDQDILSGALKGAAVGGIGAGAGQYISGLDAASSLGITDPAVAGIVNKAAQGGASSALQTGLRGGDLGDVASSFGAGALTSGIGAATGEGLQALLPEGTDMGQVQRGVNFAGKLYNVAQNPTAGGIMSLAQTGAGFLGGRESATDVLGDKYPELGDRQAPPEYEDIDNSEFRPISPFELPEIPEMAQLNGVEPSISPWEDRGPGEGGYDFSDFTPAPSPAPSQADMEYFLSTNIPNKPDTVQDLMAQYYPEPSQAPAFEPVNPFADLPPGGPMQRVEITAPRTGVYDYDAGTGDMRFPDLFDPRIDENGYGDLIPPPAAVAPPVSIKPPAPSIKIPGVGGAPSPAPAPKAKSDTDMAGLFALLGSMGGQQGQAAENYQVANVENPIMRGLVNDLLGRSYT